MLPPLQLLLDGPMQTATVQTRNKAEAGRERYFVRRIENAMRDWIYRLRQKRCNAAAQYAACRMLLESPPIPV